MAGLGIALRGIGKAVKKGISKAANMSNKTAANLAVYGTSGMIVGASVLGERRRRKRKSKKSKP